MAPTFTDPDEHQSALIIRMANLLKKERLDELTDLEREELASWLAETTDHQEWKDQLTAERMAELLEAFGESEMRIEDSLQAFHDQHLNMAPVVGFRRKRRVMWWAAAVAAAVLVGLVVLTAVWPSKRNARQPAIVKSGPAAIPPGRYTATLTLANGSHIVLDTGMKGQVVQKGSVLARYQDGKMAYEANPADKGVTYNTLATARGGQYQLVLPDGTRVWLNAASSIRYPTVFNGRERRVELTGEGYFEVADKKDQPFVVAVGGMDVTALGTEFDIMAYPEEGARRTTLVKGAVKVESKGMQQVLRPDEQSVVAPDGLMTMAPNVDIDNVIAWKLGFFQFRNMDLASIMRQIQRWYDVDVVYETKNLSEQYGGRISRNLNLSELISLLEGSGAGHFKIEGRKLIVLP